MTALKVAAMIFLVSIIGKYDFNTCIMHRYNNVNKSKYSNILLYNASIHAVSKSKYSKILLYNASIQCCEQK